MNHAGQLIYNAARIYYEEERRIDKNNEMISLITHLDCEIMKKSSVWEHYFLFRTNRKLIQMNQKGIIC